MTGQHEAPPPKSEQPPQQVESQPGPAPSTQMPDAGWYADPKMVNTFRYWDGQQWTEHRQAAIAPSVPPQADVNTTPGYLLAFLMPLVGFILGITYLSKKTTDGIAVMVLSLLAAGFWLFVLSILLGVDPNAPDGY